MNDSYVEVLIKQKTSKETSMKKVLLIVGMIICAILIIAVSALAAIWLLAIFGLVYLWKRLSMVEFEYIYYNGEMDIDKIMGMQSRKRVLSVSAKEMELLAPTGSPELRPYEKCKVYDCSSNTGKKTYEIVAEVKNQNARIIFEPNDTILQGMRMYAPRKVIL